MPTTLPALCLVMLVLCNVHASLEHEIPRRSFLSRRAIDGTRGRKYFDPEEEGAFDSFGSAGGQYNPYQEKTDLSDIRRNVPGEPGIDYPAYTTLPQTGFTCEGRSRGYYADEVAGCQVFHVCHDVLVSSFLCPIGSIFSQKLLTCDWWTKVDCSSSGKYVDVNRNSYQQDDDEMIRNAYAMISLRSGTDVTKDGLVDPDRTGSIVDYQKGRVSDYSSPLDPPTGNDLRTKFEDRRRPPPSARDFLPPPYRLKEIGRPADRHQEKFHPVQEGTKPYEDSPVIRVQKIGDPGYDDEERRRKELQEATHRRGGGNDGQFVNRFQPSYAPTVPTVTTTTRRFYSPTVPTTFRPSTLAYNSLDQAIDSSDYYLSKGSRGDGFVTPPTSAVVRAQEGRRVPSRKAGTREEDYEYPGRQGSYEYDYEDEEEEEKGSRFRVRVLDPGTRNGTLGEAFDSKVYFGFEDDFETRGSIGLGQALRQSFRGISVQRQNPARDEAAKGASLRLPGKGGDTGHGSAKGETTERQRNDETNDERGSNDSTATDAPSVIESAVKATTTTTVASLPESNASSTASSVAEFSRDTTIEGLPPRARFQIKVPDDSSTSAASSSTLDEFYPSTTESSSFARNYSEEKERATTVNNEGISDYHPTTVAEPNSDEIPSFDRSREDTSTPSLIMNDAEGGAKNASSNATLDSPLGKIHWKSLVDGNNKDSPYQVTLTMNGREQLVPVDARIGEEGERELEIIESVEPPRSTTESNDLEGGERGGAISLRRLMSELFKLDRIPRPFSSPSSFPSSNEQEPRLEQEREETDAELRARTRILYDVLTTRRAEQASAGEVGESWRGEEILDRLAENFGEPLYKGGKKGGPVFELPGEERAVDFHDGGTMEEEEEEEERKVEVSTPSSSTSAEAKTVVKTEFVPSLGFSLDTDEGREEYVEAVLGGLIEPRAAGSEKGEAILGGSFERKNETLEGKM